VSRASGSRPVLRRWKKGVAEYHSVIYARRDSGVESVKDLQGKMIGFEESFSTSGYFLPKNSLLSSGLKLKEYKDPRASVKPDEVGYVFAREDENAMTWVLRGKIVAAATGSTELDKLAGKDLANLKVIHQTVSVPRHIVSFRKDLDEKLAQKLREIMIGMEHSEEGKAVLAKWSNTTRFDDLPGGAQTALAPFMHLAKEIDRELER
jgi:phosphonate transport system substrate-binding protein